MPTYKPITLKMSTAPAYGYTSIKQMDVEGVELILTLRNTDDSDYNLTSGSTLFFKMANESGNVKVTLSEMDSPSNITRDGANVVKVLLTESMVSETGIMACELQEMHSGTFTSSQLFYLRVWPTTEDGEIIDSHEYKSLVSAYLAIDNALNVATLAKNYSDSTITEENARQAAELLRIQAESARVTAENLRGVEVANARGDHATLGDRLDEMDVGIEGNTSEVENTKLKVIRLEQEVKRYKELYEQSNPTQSPRVTSTGYGVVSLPKNAGQGPMDVKVEGLTLKNEIDYNPETWEEWALAGNASISNGLVLAGTGSAHTSYLNINAKSNTKYGLLLNVLKNTINGNFRISNSLTGTTESLFIGGFTGPYKKIILTQEVIVNNYIGFNLSSSTTEGEVKISDIRLFELHPGSEIESDFESLSADELARKYPYVQGGEPRNTSGTFRVRSVGKNLFDASGTWYYGNCKSGIVYADNGLSNPVTFPATLTFARRTIFKVFYCKENTTYTASIYNFEVTDINISLAQYESIESAVSSENALVSTSTFGLNKEATITTVSGGNILLVAISGYYDTVLEKNIIVNEVGLVQLEYGEVATEYEPYTESNMYLTAKDEQGNIAELRSLPNGTKDEINLAQGKVIIRTKEKALQATDINRITSSTNVDYVWIRKPDDFAFRGRVTEVGNSAFILEGYTNYRGGEYDDANKVGQIASSAQNNNFYLITAKGTYATLQEAQTALAGLQLIYQLAEPVEIPIQVSGSLHSYPSGTVYIEPAIADAGVYDGGFAILNTDFPIAELESVQKIDFQTGLSTELDVEQAVIAGGGLSFTHPGLTDGDIVFVTYLYDDSNYTAGKASCEYYDSRFVLKDTVTGKYYRKVETVEDGELVTQLVEV